MNLENFRILIVDDEENHREGMMTLLEEEGYSVDGAGSGQEAIEKLETAVFDLLITDYKMQEMDGMALLKYLEKYFPSIKVIMITGYGSIEKAVEAMRHGAINYITKPVKPQQLKALIRDTLQAREEDSDQDLQKRLRKYYHFHQFVGQSKAMQSVYRKIKEVAATNIPVMIIGESGTGKELVARAIHDLSPRKDAPFVAINTGAIPRELIASELFGHIKGSFTGAIADKKGKFEEANRGTLFLDEIGTMSLPVQISLLRVLETHVIERVGSSRPIQVDVRIIAASNESLEELIEKGEFREDLYYRLNVVSIEVPPLRKRIADIPYLANYYREMFNFELNKYVEKISREAMDILKKYSWPGNVREFRNVMLRSMLSVGEEKKLEVNHLPEVVRQPGIRGNVVSFKPGTPLSEVERKMIVQTIKAVNGNKLKAAKVLGISRRSLYNKLEDYNITDEEIM